MELIFVGLGESFEEVAKKSIKNYEMYRKSI